MQFVNNLTAQFNWLLQKSLITAASQQYFHGWMEAKVLLTSSNQI